MQNIKQTYSIKAPIDKVWQAFIDSKIIEAWGGGPVKMSDKEGSDFSLWGGDIHGTNTEIIKNKIIKQDWYSGNKWLKPSKVIFKFEEKGDTTIVNLTHNDVPDYDAKSIEQGWKDYYLCPIKELLEK